MAVGYDHEPLLTIDTEASDAVAGALPGWLEALARFFSWLGNGPVLTLLAAVAGLTLLWKRQWLDVIFLVCALAGSAIAVGYLKEWTDRMRPDAGSVIPLPSSAAFPSGHAASGIAGLGALTIVVAERLPSQRARVAVWSVAAIVGLAIGISRVALNVHWITDVVAGWCFGLAWLAACLLGREWLRTRG